MLSNTVCNLSKGTDSTASNSGISMGFVPGEFREEDMVLDNLGYQVNTLSHGAALSEHFCPLNILLILCYANLV